MTFSFDFDDDPPPNTPRSAPAADDGFDFKGATTPDAAGSTTRSSTRQSDDPFSFEDIYFGSSGFGGAPDIPAADVPAGRPPMHWFAASAGVAVLGLAIALLLRQSWLGLGLGWLLAGPVAIMLIGRYAQLDELQRARPIYQGSPLTRHYVTILGVLALVCVTVVAVIVAGKAAKAW